MAEKDYFTQNYDISDEFFHASVAWYSGNEQSIEFGSIKEALLAAKELYDHYAHLHTIRWIYICEGDNTIVHTYTTLAELEEAIKSE